MSEIRPRFSLLFADPDRESETIYSDEILSFLEPLPVDEAARSALDRILSLRATRKDLLFRKEIFEDFQQSPSLLSKCETICRKWEGLYETAKKEKKAAPDMPYGQIFSALQENTKSLMEHLNFLRRCADEMACESPDSGGLFAFSEFLLQHASSESVRALTEQIGNYPLLRHETAKAVLQIHSDDTGSETAADLRYLGIDDIKYLKKHSPRKEDFSVNLPKERALERTGQALCRLSDTFRTLTEGIRSAFCPLRDGLIFYHFAFSITEWAEARGFEWQFPLPSTEPGPAGKGIRDLREMEGKNALSPVSFTARPREIYEGEWGTEMLKQIARTHILSASGLPVIASTLTFCPEETIVLYDSIGKTMQQEIAALGELFHRTKKNDIVLLNHPLITVGNAPAKEIMNNLLATFLKKGASVRLATNWSTEEFL